VHYTCTRGSWLKSFHNFALNLSLIVQSHRAHAAKPLLMSDSTIFGLWTFLRRVSCNSN